MEVLVFAGIVLLFAGLGVGLAVRGRVFVRKEALAESPYRGGPAPVSSTATPRWVRALAIVTVLVGVASLLCGVPLELIAIQEVDLTAFYRHPSSTDGAVKLLVGATMCESFLFAPALATVAVLVARGRALRAAPVVSVLWILHVALIATAWFLRVVDRIAYATSHHHAALGDSAARILIGALFLSIGVAHAIALWIAARRMRVLAEANARASAATAAPA